MSINGNDDYDPNDEENASEGVNVFASRGDFGKSPLAAIGRQFNQVPHQQRDMYDRYRKAKGKLEFAELFPTWAAGEDAKKEIASAQKTVDSLAPRMKTYQESTVDRFNMRAVNVMSRELSDVRIKSYSNSRVNSVDMQVAGTQLAGSVLSGQRTYEQLMESRNEQLKVIEMRRDENVGLAQDLFGVDEETRNERLGRIGFNSDLIRRTADELTPHDIALKHLRKEGKDPESRFNHMTNMGIKANETLGRFGLEDEIKAGRGKFGDLSPQEFRKKETEAAQNLCKALDELRSATGKTSDEMKELTEKAEKASEEFEKVREAGAAGAGNGSNGWKTAQVIMSAAGAVANIAGNTFQALGVNQPMQQMANIAGAASLDNQKYEMWRSALAGNMTDRMNLSGWGAAESFGAGRGQYARWATFSRAVSSTAMAGVGALQAGEAFKNMPTGLSVGTLIGSKAFQAAIEGVQAAGENAAGAVVHGMDYANNITENQAKIQGTAAAMAAVKQKNHITGSQLQRYRDHVVGLYGASTQMYGSRGESFLDMTAGAGFMKNMQEVGLNSADMGKLSMYGAQNIGSMFNADQVIAAKRFENLGLGGADQNMQRMASLAAGGSQNPGQSLEKVLERSVASGLNSSKAIDTIVQNTGTMAEQSALSGYGDIGGQISKIILNAVNSEATNKEIAAKQAVTAFQTGELSRNDRGTGWHGQVAVGRMMRTLGVDFESGLAMQGFSSASLLGMLELDENGKPKNSNDDIRQQLFRKGINVSQDAFSDTNISASLRKAISNKALSQAEESGFEVGTGVAWERVARPWIESDPSGKNAEIWQRGLLKEMPADIREARRKWNMSQGFNGDADAAASDLLSNAGMLKDRSIALPKGHIDDDATARGALQQELTRGDVQNLEAAIHALTSTIKATDGKSGIRAINQSGKDTLDSPGPNAEAAFEASAFGKSVVQFNQASGQLMTAANTLMAAAGILELAGRESKQTVFSESFSGLFNRLTKKDAPASPDSNGNYSGWDMGM